MEDVRERLDAQDIVIKGIRGDTQIQAGALQGVQNNLIQVSKDLEQINKSLGLIATAIGEETEDGSGHYLGTGLLGRVRRVERGQRTLRELYHRWIAFLSGFVACGGTALLVLWWLIGDKLAIVLKGTGHL